MPDDPRRVVELPCLRYRPTKVLLYTNKIIRQRFPTKYVSNIKGHGRIHVHRPNFEIYQTVSKIYSVDPKTNRTRLFGLLTNLSTQLTVNARVNLPLHVCDPGDDKSNDRYISPDTRQKTSRGKKPKLITERFLRNSFPQGGVPITRPR